MANPQADYKNTPQRCDPNDQHRCRTNTPKGQCVFLAVPGSPYCILHDQQATEPAQARAALYDIKRLEVRGRLTQLKQTPGFNSLTEELAIVRLILENTLNACKDNYDLITNSGSITSLVVTIRDTLEKNMRLEQRYGDLLSIEEVGILIDRLFEIITDYITAPEDLLAIATRVEHMLAHSGEVLEQAKQKEQANAQEETESEEAEPEPEAETETATEAEEKITGDGFDAVIMDPNYK